jgi:hypothetical protein
MNAHTPMITRTEVLTGSLDVVRELRRRIENMAVGLADIGAHGGLEQNQDRKAAALRRMRGPNCTHARTAIRMEGYVTSKRWKMICAVTIHFSSNMTREKA